MKKILSIVLSFALMAAVAGCGSKDGDASSSAVSSAPSSSASEASSEAPSEPAASGTSSSASSEAPQPPSGPEYAAKMRAMLEGTGEYANNPTVTIETSEGTVKVRLFPSEAPNAVQNFMTHAQDGYYDGLTFHRVIKDFMIQGGDPAGNGTGGESIFGEPFGIEYSDNLWHFRGCLSMANAGPDSNGSQFFIVQGNSYEAQKATMEQIGFPQEIMDLFAELGGEPFLDYLSPEQQMFGYTKFGYVYEGMDVVDKIAALDTGEKLANGQPAGKTSKPVTVVKMTVNA